MTTYAGKIQRGQTPLNSLSFRAERGIAIIPKEGPLYRYDRDSSTPAFGLRSE